MNCSRIIIKLKKRCFIVNYKLKEICFKIFKKTYETNWIFHDKKFKIYKKDYWVKFCIRYRPVNTLEWILARGWWNDKWFRTEDWIFNDWKV